MAEVKVYFDRQGRTLTVWFTDRRDEYVCEETGDEVVLIKDAAGRVLGSRNSTSRCLIRTPCTWSSKPFRPDQAAEQRDEADALGRLTPARGRGLSRTSGPVTGRSSIVARNLGDRGLVLPLRATDERLSIQGWSLRSMT